MLDRWTYVQMFTPFKSRNYLYGFRKITTKMIVQQLRGDTSIDPPETDLEVFLQVANLADSLPYNLLVHPKGFRFSRYTCEPACVEETADYEPAATKLVVADDGGDFKARFDLPELTLYEQDGRKIDVNTFWYSLVDFNG